MTRRTIDLRSDTVTRPTPGMREAMAWAEVGDDVLGDDPTVNALQHHVARLLGKEASLFVPTGTMANLLAVLAQTRPGDSVLLHEDAHPFNYESGNLAMVAGVQARPLTGPYGILSAEDVFKGIVSGADHHHSPTTLVAIENTTNRGGGAIYPIETAAAIAAVARDRGLRVHCDGARLFNAVVETGIPAAEYARHADTVSFCFSKGLGAPVGSILAGDADTIDRAHRFRKMLGGGMRQAGILAAGALYALEHHVERLRDDHARAHRFRDMLMDIPGIAFPLPSPTNIIYLEVADAREVRDRLAAEGVAVLTTGLRRIRAVFHLDVSDEDLERVIDAFRRAVPSS
ncbi:MAG: GntG family PLP-dependent aldolase [FCB group bacterium]|jgi:threonine aldolase|nr:GntG family PLP-dependent aldolase [FCB group bacterium]